MNIINCGALSKLRNMLTGRYNVYNIMLCVCVENDNDSLISLWYNEQGIM